MPETPSNDLSSLAVAVSSAGFLAELAAMAKRLGLPSLGVLEAPSDAGTSLLLYKNAQAWGLYDTAKKGAPGPISVDFLQGVNDHRRRFGGGAKQLIARAVGCAKGHRPAVLDATAGLGRDAFVLASLGCTLSLLERHNVIHALLDDGLQRARQQCSSDDAAVFARMQVQHGDAVEYLRASQELDWPVIYLDPMYPEREKSAAVKKEMRYFHTLNIDAGGGEELLCAALDSALNRVVVKRPLKAEYLAGEQPSYSLKSKATRYDIYALKRFG